MFEHYFSKKINGLNFLFDCDAFVWANINTGFAVTAFIRFIDGEFAIFKNQNFHRTDVCAVTTIIAFAGVYCNVSHLFNLQK